MESIHTNKEYEKEYKEQFRNMTDEQIEIHIGLEKVRNVIEGFDENYGIDKIRKLVKEIKQEQTEVMNKQICKGCSKEKEESKFKTCEKCREKNKNQHYKNKEKNNERRRNHYYENREHALEYAKAYNEEHREEINERRRKHRVNNIETVNAKIKWMTCPVCNNYEIKCSNYKRHTQTILHQENLKQLGE